MMHLLLLAALFAAIAMSGCLSSSVKGPSINVVNMDIVPGFVKTSTIELKVTTYIKNYGEDRIAKTSKNTSLLLRAISTDRDFLTNQTRVFIGKIPNGKTVNVTQTLILPKKGGYRLEAELFEEDAKVDTGTRTVYNLDSIPADTKVIGLRIDGMDFLVRKATEGKAVIQNDIYVTNVGANPSQDYKLMAKATEADSKLVADKQWNSTGVIGPDETAIRSISLTVPDKYNYVIDVFIWSNSTIVGQGTDYVLLNATTTLGKDTRIATRGTSTGNFVAENVTPARSMDIGRFEGAAEQRAAEHPAPGFNILLALIAVGLVVMLGRRRL